MRRGHDDPLHRAVGLAVLDRRDDLLHEGQVEGVGGRAVEADDGDSAGGVLLARLPDGKISSLHFLGLRHGGGCGGAIQGILQRSIAEP